MRHTTPVFQIVAPRVVHQHLAHHVRHAIDQLDQRARSTGRRGAAEHAGDRLVNHFRRTQRVLVALVLHQPAGDAAQACVELGQLGATLTIALGFRLHRHRSCTPATAF